MADRDTQAVAAIGRRLQLYLQHRGLTQSQATELLGTSPQVLANMAAGANVAGKTLARVAATFPELNLDWWLLGIGEMTTQAPGIASPTKRRESLRERTEILAAQPLAKTAKAQETQARQWAELLNLGLLERVDILAENLMYQDRLVALLTEELKAHGKD